MENISAVNSKAVSVWDLSSGQIEFSVLIKGFEFERALMQEHFNENYMESDSYPKATFKGVVENSSALAFTKDNTYKVKVNGSLTMHGVTKPLSIPATVVVKGGAVSASATFTVSAEDYKIKIPSIVAEKISKQITVNIDVPSYQNLK
jgi:polyisoprenoid-binding protein YceI